MIQIPGYFFACAAIVRSIEFNRFTNHFTIRIRHRLLIISNLINLLPVSAVQMHTQTMNPMDCWFQSWNWDLINSLSTLIMPDMHPAKYTASLSDLASSNQCGLRKQEHTHTSVKWTDHLYQGCTTRGPEPAPERVLSGPRSRLKI